MYALSYPRNVSDNYKHSIQLHRVESIVRNSYVFHSEVTCKKLSAPSNGKVFAPRNEYGAKARYSCNPGYRLTLGDEQRQCQSDGTWSGTEPTCEGTQILFIFNFSASKLEF